MNLTTGTEINGRTIINKTTAKGHTIYTVICNHCGRQHDVRGNRIITSTCRCIAQTDLGRALVAESSKLRPSTVRHNLEDLQVGNIINNRTVKQVHKKTSSYTVQCNDCGSCRVVSAYNLQVRQVACACSKGKKISETKYTKRRDKYEYHEGDSINGRVIVKAHENRLAYDLLCNRCGKTVTVDQGHLKNNKIGCNCTNSDNNKTRHQLNRNRRIRLSVGDCIQDRIVTKVHKDKMEYTVYCGACDTEVDITSYDLLIKNTGCACRAMAKRSATLRRTRFRSKAEHKLREYIEDLGFRTEHYASGYRELDIFIPELKVGIEFNGLYWHSEKFKKPKDHIDKKLYYKNLGIDVLNIWESQWNDRQDQVKSFIRSKLGKNKNRVGVRVCDVRQISKEEAAKFLDAYHIQGRHVQHIAAIGAYYKEELIAVVTFSKHHRGGSSIVLSRLCSKTNWTCAGFLSKAMKQVRTITDQPIITWVDRCLSEGPGYLAAGFILDKVLPPDYFYVKNGRKIIPKQSFRKIDERTERQRAKDERLQRVYDCGKIRFIYK